MKQAKVLNEKELKKVIDFIDATDTQNGIGQCCLRITVVCELKRLPI